MKVKLDARHKLASEPESNSTSCIRIVLYSSFYKPNSTAQLLFLVIVW